jgi:alpha-L-rhamnosidase
MYGLIHSDWTLQADSFNLRVTIPANTTATVYMPGTDLSYITENGLPAATAQGLTFLSMQNGYAVFLVESGSYSFSSRLQ